MLYRHIRVMGHIPNRSLRSEDTTAKPNLWRKLGREVKEGQYPVAVTNPREMRRYLNNDNRGAASAAIW